MYYFLYHINTFWHKCTCWVIQISLILLKETCLGFNEKKNLVKYAAHSRWNPTLTKLQNKEIVLVCLEITQQLNENDRRKVDISRLFDYELFDRGLQRQASNIFLASWVLCLLKMQRDAENRVGPESILFYHNYYFNAV